MTSGFCRNSEILCSLQQKNVLALSSIVFIGTTYCPFYLFCSSLTPHLSPAFTGNPHCLSSSRPCLFAWPFSQTSSCSRSFHGLSSLLLKATISTYPFQSTTALHPFSSFLLFPWFIPSYQTFYFSLSFSFLTLSL